MRHWGPSLFHIDDLPFGEGLSKLPSVFTPFREKVERTCKVRPELPAPRPGDLPLPGPLPMGLQQLAGDLPGWEALPWPVGKVPVRVAANPKAALQFKVIWACLVVFLSACVVYDCAQPPHGP